MHTRDPTCLPPGPTYSLPSPSPGAGERDAALRCLRAETHLKQIATLSSDRCLPGASGVRARAWGHPGAYEAETLCCVTDAANGHQASASVTASLSLSVRPSSLDYLLYRRHREGPEGDSPLPRGRDSTEGQAVPCLSAPQHRDSPEVLACPGQPH